MRNREMIFRCIAIPLVLLQLSLLTFNFLRFPPLPYLLFDDLLRNDYEISTPIKSSALLKNLNMDSRTKVAAATASVVPFHCIICFQEFCLKDRPPVVLPCGHTFLCLPCSKRLKRCMECREPLYITVPPNTGNKPLNNDRCVAAAPSMYSRPTGRQSPLQYPSTPPQAHARPPVPIQIPIPIPKNVVLISMIEASERHAVEGESSDSVKSEGSMDDNDEEEYDLNQIISGMATFAGSCGTYAVRESLVIIPSHPKKKIPQQEEPENLPENEIAIIKEPVSLGKGQTIQVVEFEAGVAKLARGKGFVVANSSQLVKIGGPLDNVCRLEGLLDVVARRGADLQKELDDNKKVEADLSKQIEFGFSMEPSHPIVTENRALSVAGSFDQPDLECLTPVSGAGKNLHYCTTPEHTGRSTEFFIDNSFENGHSSDVDLSSLPQNSIVDNTDIQNIPRLPSYRLMPDENLDVIYGCGALLGNSYVFTRDGHNARNTFEPPAIEEPVDEAQENSRRSNGSRSPNPGLSASFSSSFDAVDFRTGLSGHRALNTSKFKNVHSPNQRGHGRLMMSQHAGIGQARRPMHRSNNNSPSY